MRFVWLIALAASALMAVPAQAAKFVQFTLGGHGLVTSYDYNYYPYGIIKESDFIVTFSIDVERNWYTDPNWDGRYISDGSYFFGAFGGDNYVMRIANGVLTAEDHSNNGYLDNNSTLTMYLDPAIQTFAGIHSGPGTGNAHVAFGGQLNGFDFNGALSFIQTSSTDTFSGITAYAVPEPATWAMMIIGFGAIGGAMRRRGQREALAHA